MRDRCMSILISLLAGLLGGAIGRSVFSQPVAFAQNSQNVQEIENLKEELNRYKTTPKPTTKVVRAERIELINNHGKPLAVFEVEYSDALPAGTPILTLSDRDEFAHRDRKAVLNLSNLSLSNGTDESVIVGPELGLMLRDPRGGTSVGVVPTPFGSEMGLVVYDRSGVANVNSRSVSISDRSGRPVATLP